MWMTVRAASLQPIWLSAWLVTTRCRRCCTGRGRPLSCLAGDPVRSKGRELDYLPSGASLMCSIQLTFLRKSWRSGWWRTWRGTTTHCRTDLFRWMEQRKLPITSWSFWVQEFMHFQPEQGPKNRIRGQHLATGSHTFVLSETLALTSMRDTKRIDSRFLSIIQEASARLKSHCERKGIRLPDL